jgi:F-type H+-transporting ATPase subunit a
MTDITLDDPVVLQLGPVPITGSLVTSVVISAAIATFGHLATRRLSLVPGKAQAALELIVTAIESQIREVAPQGDPSRFVPMLGTLFLFLATANLTLILPGVHPPTEHIETPMALALLVFLMVPIAGIRTQGLKGYLKHYLEPTPIFAPLELVSEVTRTFSLMIRIFGNMMSHGLILAVVAALAGLLVPIPVVALGLLIGLIQAYIFTILATTYAAAAVATHQSGSDVQHREVTS